MSDKIPRPCAVLFDMDGTLTAPLLDFARIKTDMGIGEQAILEALAEMAPKDRLIAEEILHRHEDEAAAASTLNAGCTALLARLEHLGIGTALITRNSRRSVETVVGKHGLKIGKLYAREDGRAKPEPELLHRACTELGIRQTDAWMVGDGQYDVEAGAAAGIATVWVSHGRERWFATPPWQVVRDLIEFAELLERCR